MRDNAAMRGDRTDLQRAAQLFGIIFLLVGIAGFIPGITTNYDDLTNFDDEGAQLLGFVGVNILENIVHLAYGVAGLYLSRDWDWSRAYFLGGGAIYLVVWLYGLFTDNDSGANFLGLNAAADWIHLLLGVTMLAVGLVLGRERPTARERAAT